MWERYVFGICFLMAASYSLPPSHCYFWFLRFLSQMELPPSPFFSPFRFVSPQSLFLHFFAVEKNNTSWSPSCFLLRKLGYSFGFSTWLSMVFR